MCFRQRNSETPLRLEMLVDAETTDAASAVAYQSLQARQQALQTSMIEQLAHSNTSEDSLTQQVQSLQSELAAAHSERDAAMAGMKALQEYDEAKKCNLHVGLSQVGCQETCM